MGDMEMRGFVFSVVYIMLFSLLVGTIPVGLQGLEGNANVVTPLDPEFLTGFQYQENWTRTDYAQFKVYWKIYDYNLGGYKWRSQYYNVGKEFVHYRKITAWGIWLGAVRTATFYCPNGTDRGETITFDEINGDSDDGITRYDMILGNGESAGSLIFGWNTTLYADSEDAWDNDVLVLVHGLGIDEIQSLNIGDLILGLLFWQVPEVPFALQAIIVFPLYACIAFLIFFFVISVIPFLGGA